MEFIKKRYPDRFIYCKVDKISFQDSIAPFIEINERINSYEDLFFIKSIKDALYSLYLEEIILTDKFILNIKCFPQQQHDRRFAANESFELKLISDFINSCKFHKVTILHPHSDVLPALINNCEVIDNSAYILDVLNVLESFGCTYENTALMSTDANGFKALSKICDKINWKGKMFSASKSRKEGVLSQVVDIPDFEGMNILLVDDICIYGGTLVGLGKMLKEKNCGNLYFAVTHTTVNNPNLELNDIYKQCFTTDSKFDNYEHRVYILNSDKYFEKYIKL